MERRPRVLLIYPRFTHSYVLSYEFMARLLPGKDGVMPSTALLLVAGLFDEAGFEVRHIDENLDEVRDEDIDWADVCAFSGMHQQRAQMTSLIERANSRGKITVLGGSSVNVCPEFYPMADVLHIGELGDATKDMVAFLRKLEKPAAQLRYETKEKLSLDEQPMPAIQLVDPHRYLLMPLQFSVGCPFTCEFCDVPMIYGRVARLKTPARVVRELDALYETGFIGSIMFVDDNLIANRKALRELLPELEKWQAAHDYPFMFSSESSINMARDEEILELLRKARFTHIFVGIESPDPGTLVQISKKQNTMDPIFESLQTINKHGIEILGGYILGFDSDTLETGKLMTRTIDETQVPILIFNMVAALPKTPLWERMQREGRLIADEELKLDNVLGCLNTNVRTILPVEQTKRMLIDTMRDAYSAEKVWARFQWNLENVYGKQKFGRPPSKKWAHLKRMAPFALKAMWNVLKAGFVSEYRALFRKYLWTAIKLRVTGKIPSLIDVIFKAVPPAHHLIRWNQAYLANQAHIPAHETVAPRKLAANG